MKKETKLKIKHICISLNMRHNHTGKQAVIAHFQFETVTKNRCLSL